MIYDRVYDLDPRFNNVKVYENVMTDIDDQIGVKFDKLYFYPDKGVLWDPETDQTFKFDVLGD